MPKPVSITVLVSGRGSNLAALHEKADGYLIKSIISNNPDALALQWADDRSIPKRVVSRSQFANLADFKAGVLEAVNETEPDLVVLAGFMVVIQPEFVRAYQGRIINIHPSLLPKFRGLDTHQRALEAGETHHGATVHFVADGVDTGEIIAQGVVPVLPNDTAEQLAQRTLTIEHKLYPWVVKHLSSGEIKLVADQVSYTDRVRSQALAEGFILQGVAVLPLST
jgi:phosphoribosylglycinamide formyltransferase-1